MNTISRFYLLGAGARTACLERARLREDVDLHSEAWVLVTQATESPRWAGGQNPLPGHNWSLLVPLSDDPTILEEEMDLEQRLDLATRGTVEIITAADLKRVLEEKKKPRAYWGFECSGKQRS